LAFKPPSGFLPSFLVQAAVFIIVPYTRKIFAEASLF
jgi:hypothetical protein